jgi:hypothetical protein
MLIITATNYLVNPYNVFQPNHHTHYNRLKENVASDRMTFTYEMHHIQPQTLMVGTSRIGFFNSSLLKPYAPSPIFNLALAGSSVYEQRRYIEYAVAHFPIKTIVWSLDFFSFNPDKIPYESFSEERLNHSTYLDDYMLALFSYATFKQSLKTLSVNSRPYDTNISEFYEQQAYRHVQGELLTKKEIRHNADTTLNEYATIKGFLSSDNFASPHSIDPKLSEVSKIITLCKQKHITCIVYTSPVYREHLDMISYLGLGNTYEYWKINLANITNYWDFNTYNSITNNLMNFRDSSHIRSNNSQFIFSKLFNDTKVVSPSDFGVYVTKENVHQHIETQKRLIHPFQSSILLTKKKSI